MNSFEYAGPLTVEGAVSLLSPQWGDVEILAGGTDLLALMKDYVVVPKRLVNIKKIKSLQEVEYSASKGLNVGALVTLYDLSIDPNVTKNYPMLALALSSAASPQIRNRATIAGNLCQRPRCWYFRNGYGLLAGAPGGRSLVLEGDNRYHAILGNDGPAYFVSPSTVAPTLIALEAVVQIAGSKGTREIPLEQFYVLPASDSDREHALSSNELVLGIRVPPPNGASCAYYEVRQKHGFDWPLATATVRLQMDHGQVKSAKVMLSHVAPVPWRSKEAEAALAGEQLTLQLARSAALAAIKPAKHLGQNAYKIPISCTAVERAILLASGVG
jgi:xanthine dehydrogenase YagS FAD-binding subunit